MSGLSYLYNSNASYQNITSNPHVKSAHAVMLSLDIVGLSLNVCLLVTLILLGGRHVNMRLLLGNISFVSIVVCLFQPFKVVYESVRYADVQNGTKMSAKECWLLDMPLSCSCTTLANSMMAVAIERGVATFQHSKYDRKSCKLAILLMTLAWSEAIVVWFGGYWFSDAKIRLPICYSVFSASPFLTAHYLVEVMLLSAAIIPIYWKLLQVNRAKLMDFCANQAQLSLESRVQLRHSIELAETLLPTVITHSLLWFAIVGATLLLVVVPPTETLTIDDRLAYFSWVAVLVALQNVLFPLIIFMKHQPIRIKLLELGMRVFPACRSVLKRRVQPFQRTIHVGQAPAATRRSSSSLTGSSESHAAGTVGCGIGPDGTSHFILLQKIFNVQVCITEAALPPAPVVSSNRRLRPSKSYRPSSSPSINISTWSEIQQRQLGKNT